MSKVSIVVPHDAERSMTAVRSAASSKDFSPAQILPKVSLIYTSDVFELESSELF